MKQFLIPRLGCGVKERPATSSLIGMLSMIKPVLANKSRLPPMKHGNSCRTPMAVLAAFLFVILVQTAFAEAGANQEIGVPQPMEVRAKGCFGVVLSPDGDGFYSVRDGLLTHYQIAPFKKISSVAIDETQLKDIPEKDSCRVLITDDGSNLILVFRGWLVSLDRRTGKISRKVERQAVRTDVGLPSEAVTLNGNDLVILSEFNDPERGVWFYLSVLDVNIFSLKRPAFDVRGKFEFSYGYGAVKGVAKIQERLYLSSGKTLAVLNSKTYEPELTLTCPKMYYGEDTRTFWTSPMISRDHRKLYTVNATVVNDYLAKAQKAFGEPQNIRDNFVLIFDQATRQSSIEPTDRKMEGERRRDLYEPWLFWGTTTGNRDYVATTLARWYAQIASRNGNMDYRFYQYESGEAILEEMQLPVTPGVMQYVMKTYHLTPAAKQYLLMKNREGKVVPINDATFEKYHANSAR